jgi:hypothetical protein
MHLAIVEHMQNETHLPIVITNRATVHVLTVEELRDLANFRALPRPPALRSAPPTVIGNAVNVMRIPTGRRSFTHPMMKNTSDFYKHVESISKWC